MTVLIILQRSEKARRLFSDRTVFRKQMEHRIVQRENPCRRLLVVLGDSLPYLDQVVIFRLSQQGEPRHAHLRSLFPASSDPGLLQQAPSCC